MATIFLRKTLSGFVPSDEAGREVSKNFRAGDIYRADVKKPRSYRHHCLAMALLNLTYENLPELYEGRWASFNDFRYGVAIEAGHCLEVVTPSGEIFKQARSISYDELDEAEFSEVMPKFMGVCAQILAMENDYLAEEVARYAHDKYGMRP